MGAYNYFIPTASKKVQIGDAREDVHFLKYAYKSRFDGMPAITEATNSRIKRAWERRSSGPKYVASSTAMGEGVYIYTGLCLNWQPLISEEYLSRSARLAGVMEEVDGKLVFVPRITYRVVLASDVDQYYAEYYRLRARIVELFGEGEFEMARKGHMGLTDITVRTNEQIASLVLLMEGRVIRGATPSNRL